MEYISRSAIDTFEFAKALAGRLKGGEVIALTGDLGAGKTVFSKGIAAGLGVKENVVSPTFTIIRRYDGRLILNHLDLYRITSAAEISELGVDELFSPDSVCVIEWAGNAGGYLPDNRVEIIIEKTGEETRKIIMREQF